MGSGREESDEKENSKKKDGNAPSQDTGGQPPEQVVKEPSSRRKSIQSNANTGEHAIHQRCQMPTWPTYAERSESRKALLLQARREIWVECNARNVLGPLELVSVGAKGTTMRSRIFLIFVSSKDSSFVLSSMRRSLRSSIASVQL